jgi:biotin synthase
VNKLAKNGNLTRQEFKTLLSADNAEYLHKKARETALRVFGNVIYTRGLIEFSNYCKNDCFYCGLRKSNTATVRYRLTDKQVLDCCEEGYKLGIRTFVLQSGEDLHFTDETLCGLIKRIKSDYPDCAVTLSIGERSYDSLQRLKKSGADRFLLRQETANTEYYSTLHPQEMQLQSRLECLYNAQKAGFQTGCGFLIGSPGQTTAHIIDDLLFIKDFSPEMVGVGPFIPCKDTPFADSPQGDLDLVLNTLAILRLMKPTLLLPATTALGSICDTGREKGILAGANVIMPNLSPEDSRNKYLLYNGKICTEESARICCERVFKSIEQIGYKIVASRGDYREDY